MVGVEELDWPGHIPDHNHNATSPDIFIRRMEVLIRAKWIMYGIGRSGRTYCMDVMVHKALAK